MPNSNVFCNSPWYKLQIYWDGSLGFCCQENEKMYPAEQDKIYNIQNMSIREWFDSEPMRQARLMMSNDQRNSVCTRCYHEESVKFSSRRHRSNQKSVIFTKQNFADSYQQSPGWPKFEHSFCNQGAYDGMPIDLHIDLGNFCNLSCKMCNPKASSQIAAQYVRWGIPDSQQYLGNDWTRNESVWQRMLEELLTIPNLANIHFMGGETLITSRFEQFVDFMTQHKKFDLHFSFVTNGTTFNLDLINKLKKFRRVGIEVSIETVTEHNSYQRQGTDTDVVLKNIHRYLEHCNSENITLTARPAISALTIGNYWTLLQYCLEQKIMVKSLLVTDPAYLSAEVLPTEVKQLYAARYQEFVQHSGLESMDLDQDYNESDPNQLGRIIKQQALQCINLLEQPQPHNSDQLLTEMVSWCSQWDQVHGYNARTLYPELKDVLDQYGY